jgi:predicted CXXCH cytochrome family protein
MSFYGIPTDQDELYQKSVHYESMVQKGDLSAPTCNDCHGNHGAIPPGIESIDNVCGTCHFSNKELFDKSPHLEAFKDMDQPECVTCHSNHEIKHTGEYMMDTETGVCWDCHDTDSVAGQTTLSLISELEGLIRKHEVADSLITLAETKGMEVQEFKVKLIDNNSHITSARNLVHTLSLEAMKEETDPGNVLAESIIEGGFEALEEISTRRIGMLISLLFILLVILALYFKIKLLPQPKEKT